MLERYPLLRAYETTAAGAVTLGGLPSWVQESGSSLSNKKLSDTVTIGSGATRLGMEFDFQRWIAILTIR